MSRVRWFATITYRTKAGLEPVEHALSELEDIQDLVERGPHFDTVHSIVINRVNHCDSPSLTIEEATEL